SLSSFGRTPRFSRNGPQNPPATPLESTLTNRYENKALKVLCFDRLSQNPGRGSAPSSPLTNPSPLPSRLRKKLDGGRLFLFFFRGAVFFLGHRGLFSVSHDVSDHQTDHSLCPTPPLAPAGSWPAPGCKPRR